MEKNRLRSSKRSVKWRQKFVRQRELHKQIRRNALDILKSDNFDSTKECIQHGNMTVNNHCMNVARYSLAISRRLPVKCNEKDLVRGALLHDYFLYDWHDKDHTNPMRLHGFFHPGIALKNASEEYELTPREMDIIKKHMWPLTPIPPMCREAWIVTAADKWCSFLETVRIHRGHGRRKFRLRDIRNTDFQKECHSDG